VERNSFLQFSELEKIVQIYGIKTKSLEPIFRQLFIGKELSLSDEINVVENLPKALSFSARLSKPLQCDALGRPHKPTSPSFQVRQMNKLLLQLKKISPVELPASDLAYKAFWKQICSETNVSFHLFYETQVNEIPDYLEKKCTIQKINFKYSPEDIFCASKATALNILTHTNLDISFQKAFPEVKQKNGKFILPATFVEQYLRCPFQFYLNKSLGLKSIPSSSILDEDSLELGNKAHILLEFFMKLFNECFEQTRDKNISSLLLNSFLTTFSNQNFSLAQSSILWIDFFRNFAIENKIEGEYFKTLYLEMVGTIFDSRPVEREYLKRIACRFSLTELNIFKQNSLKVQGAFLELPFQWEVSNAVLTGRIDRVDTHLESYKLYDYKTSSVSKTKKNLLLFPQNKLLENPATHFSFQGAIYCAAWAQEFKEMPVESFSLYRTKNIQPDADIMMTSFESKEPNFTDRVKELAENTIQELTGGNFYPKPIQKEVCNFCEYQSICPKK
jgi:ATP-dependent helicase/DNAse subunit B